MNYFEKIAAFLKEQGEAAFGYSDKYIFIQERVDGGYEADIYDSKTDFINEVEPMDGGIFESENTMEALEFFTEDLL